MNVCCLVEVFLFTGIGYVVRIALCTPSYSLSFDPFLDDALSFSLNWIGLSSLKHNVKNTQMIVVAIESIRKSSLDYFPCVETITVTRNGPSR